MKELSVSMQNALSLESRERMTRGGYPEFAGCVPLQ